ncbi:MAG: FMN-binding protein [Firmicutes bacterium]|nr:FMN-binding protein [Bacillota bacterium]
MDDNRQWMLRLMGLALILAMVMGYQIKALAWHSEVVQNEAQVHAAEEYNAEIRAAQEQAAQRKGPAGQAGRDADAAKTYKDGSYTASGRGFGGDITLTVTIAGGRISDITINDASGEDKAYFDMAVTLLQTIISGQSADVDAVSGATYSSNGILTAVRNALEEAAQ